MFNYEIKNDGVLDYLDKNPEFGSILLNAIPFIENSYKSFFKVVLKHSFFQDGYDDTGMLWANIYTYMEVEDAFASMDKFDKEYYFKLPRDIRSKISFDFMTF